MPRRRAEEVVLGAAATLGVTARELEVLRLLGEGLSNKDIGARLYLSPRTVERHVASLTVKAGGLDVASSSRSPPGASALTDGPSR